MNDTPSNCYRYIRYENAIESSVGIVRIILFVFDEWTSKNEWRVVQFSLVTCMQSSIFLQWVRQVFVCIMCFNWLNVCNFFFFSFSLCFKPFSFCLFIYLIWSSILYAEASANSLIAPFCCFFFLAKLDSIEQTTGRLFFNHEMIKIAACYIYSKV